MKTYTVFKFDPNSWHMDGSHVILRDCGHKHKSPRTAARCKQTLLAYNRHAHMWSAAWHGCCIRRSDGSPLTTDEEYEAMEAER